MAKQTYINDEGDKSSLESDKKSVPDSRGYNNEPDFDSENEDNDDNGPPPLIPRFATDYDSEDDEDIHCQTSTKNVQTRLDRTLG